MARPGYIQARNVYYQSLRNIDSAQDSINRLETETAGYPAELVQIHKQDRLQALAAARLDADRAKIAFDAFSTRPVKPEKKYFEYKFGVSISLDHALHTRIAAKCADSGLSMAELIRQALTAYLA